MWWVDCVCVYLIILTFMCCGFQYVFMCVCFALCDESSKASAYNLCIHIKIHHNHCVISIFTTGRYSHFIPHHYIACTWLGRSLISFKNVKDKVVTLLKSYKTSHSSASIAITGHSLGAAMAAHCMAELTHEGYAIKTLYSFGMPRVGNEAFEKWYINTVSGTFRVVHKRDPVPHLPLSSFGFHHMAYEVYLCHSIDV